MAIHKQKVRELVAIIDTITYKYLHERMPEITNRELWCILQEVAASHLVTEINEEIRNNPGEEPEQVTKACVEEYESDMRDSMNALLIENFEVN